jgi:PAS domain S-box-containing protein
MMNRFLKGPYFVAGLCIAISYYFVDAAMMAFVFEEGGSLRDNIVMPSAHDIWMRSSIAVVLILFGALFQERMNLQREHNDSLERGISDSESRLNLIIDSVPAGISYFDKDVKFRFANDRYKSLLNIQPDTLIGMTLRKAVGKEAYSRAEKNVKRALAGEAVTFENTLRGSGAGPITVSISYVPHHLQNGTVVGFFAVVYDITKLKEAEHVIQVTAEEALSESEERYRRIIETTKEGFWRIGMDMRIIEVNDAACEMLGFPREEMLGKRPYDFTSDAETPSLKTLIRTDIGQRGVAKNWEGRFVKRDGSPLDIRIAATNFFGPDGKPTGRFAFITDLTEQKEREYQLRQSQKMEALGTLSGGIAHDFNNIIYPIFIYANLLLEKFDADSEEYSDLIEITNAAQRAKDLVSQILMFSRRSEGVKHVCDLVPVIKEAMKLMRAALPANITLEEKIPDGIVPVFCDSSQMYQVVVDICTNAGHAILDSGKITIALDSSELEGIVCFDGTVIHGNYCRLTVTDNGIGMDDGTQAKIFDPFFTTREVGQGTGLGLSTVFGIVQDHEGGIKVTSEVGKGATFAIFLPLAEGPVEELPESRANVQDYTGTEAILLVDDEKSIRNSVRSCLEGVGYNVTAVADGQEALDIFAEDLDRFDLVVTDLTMPKMTGEELSHELMRLRRNTPVILCTGHGTTISAERSDAAGISALLQKPLAPADLRRLVRKVLDQANI